MSDRRLNYSLTPSHKRRRERVEESKSSRNVLKFKGRSETNIDCPTDFDSFHNSDNFTKKSDISDKASEQRQPIRTMKTLGGKTSKFKPLKSLSKVDDKESPSNSELSSQRVGSSHRLQSGSADDDSVSIYSHSEDISDSYSVTDTNESHQVKNYRPGMEFLYLRNVLDHEEAPKIKVAK